MKKSKTASDVNKDLNRFIYIYIFIQKYLKSYVQGTFKNPSLSVRMSSYVQQMASGETAHDKRL